MAARESDRAHELLPHDEREIVVRADLDALDDDECVTVSLHFLRGPRHPVAGEPVYLLDRAGRGCVGRVESVHGWTARVRPDWSA